MAGRDTKRPPPPRMAVLFDLDGTLIDSIELILNSAKHAFSDREHNVPSEADWLSGVGRPLDAMFRRYARDDADVEALIARYREYQLAHHDRLVRCYDQVTETVGALHAANHPIAVVTSKTERLARRGLEHVGLGSYFQVIVGCDSCTRHKPDPEPVLRALELLDAVPGNSMFVGDSVFDMQAGHAAGVVTVAALWGPFSREDLAATRPHHYLDRMRDLPGLITRVQTGGNKGSA